MVAPLLLVLALAAPAGAAPGNDGFEHRFLVPRAVDNVDEAFGNNAEASKEAGEPNHAGDPGGRSVWYTLDGGEATVVVDTCGSSVDTLLAAYTGSSVSTLTELASNDDTAGCGPDGHGSRMVVSPPGTGQTWIAVDAKGGAGGAFRVRVLENDDFGSANSLPTGRASNLRATKQPGEPDHAGDPGGASVWYRTGENLDGRRRVIDTCGPATAIDTLIGVYTGTGVSELTEVASNDDTAGCGPGGHGSRVVLPTPQGEFRVAVDAKGGVGGVFDLRQHTQPLNDEFAAADVADQAHSPVDTVAAAKETAEPAHAGNSGGRSVWYRLTPAHTGRYVFDTCTSETDFDTVLAVYTGSGVGALTEVVSNDDSPGCGSGGTGSKVAFTAAAGTDYHLAIDDKAGAGGTVRLEQVDQRRLRQRRERRGRSAQLGRDRQRGRHEAARGARPCRRRRRQVSVVRADPGPQRPGNRDDVRRRATTPSPSSPPTPGLASRG